MVSNNGSNISDDSRPVDPAAGLTEDPGTSVVPAGSTAVITAEDVKSVVGRNARDLIMDNPQDMAKAEAIAAKIDILKQNDIAMLGGEAMKPIATIGARFTSTIERSDPTEIIEAIEALEDVLSGAADEDFIFKLRKIFNQFPILKQLFGTLGKVKSVNDYVEDIVEGLVASQEDLKEDNVMYGLISEESIKTRRQMLIVAAAGEIALERERALLPALRKEAADSGDAEKGIILKRHEDGVDSLDVQTTHLQEVAFLQLVTVPQCDQMIASNIKLIRTITTQVVVMVPQWKVTLAMALGIKRSEAIRIAQERVRASFEKSILEASAMLRTSAVESARGASRPMLGSETLETVATDLRETLSEVKQIMAESATERSELRDNITKLTRSVTEALTVGSDSTLSPQVV